MSLTDPTTGVLAILIPVLVGLGALGMARMEAWLDRSGRGGAPVPAARNTGGRQGAGRD